MNMERFEQQVKFILELDQEADTSHRTWKA